MLSGGTVALRFDGIIAYCIRNGSMQLMFNSPLQKKEPDAVSREMELLFAEQDFVRVRKVGNIILLGDRLISIMHSLDSCLRVFMPYGTLE